MFGNTNKELEKAFEQPTVSNPLEHVVMCEGGCKAHYGEVKKVHIIDDSISKDWGILTYCESAVDEDISRGFTVLDT